MNMKLYHATLEKNLESICEKGILPREMTSLSTYGQTIYESRTGLVYLSRIGLLLHGLKHWRAGRIPALLEVDVSRSRLLPDEDYLAALRMSETGETFEEALPQCDPRMCPQLAIACLDQFGSAAHDGPIPPRRICRAAVVTDERFWRAAEFLADGPGPLVAPRLQEMIRLAMGDIGRVTTLGFRTASGEAGCLRIRPGGREVISRTRGRLVRRAA
jgi:hypothetical protein